MQFRPLVLVALAHSIGWGIRGNFGHEYGAMIPGALSALALCIALPCPSCVSAWRSSDSPAP